MVRDNVQGDNPRRLLGTTAKITATGNPTLLVPKPVFLARNNALRLPFRADGQASRPDRLIGRCQPQHRDAVPPAQGWARKSLHSPGTPLSECRPRSLKLIPDPATRSRTVLETSSSLGAAADDTRAPIMDRDTSEIVAHQFAFPGVKSQYGARDPARLYLV